MIVERICFALDGLRRYWVLLILPLLVGLPIALLVWKLAPIEYEAKSTILMLSANRGAEWSGGGSRQNAIEQIAVLEAWLKSDQVLGELLPQLLDGPPPTSPEVLSVVTKVLRRSLTLQLAGSAVLEVKLQGSEAKGLGRKLEIIVTRLLEGVLKPEAGILSASQLIVARRREAIAEANQALTAAIKESGIGAPDKVRTELQARYSLKREARSAPADSSTEANAGEPSQGVQEARAGTAAELAALARLDRLFEAYEDARFAYQQVRDGSGSTPISYVRVFDAPERLTVIGRPRDPIVGTSSGGKFAVAVMLLSGLLSLGLAGICVILDTRLRVGEDFASIAGVPVVARLTRLRRVRK